VQIPEPAPHLLSLFIERKMKRPNAPDPFEAPILTRENANRKFKFFCIPILPANIRRNCGNVARNPYEQAV
jgi:hypothetical protein